MRAQVTKEPVLRRSVSLCQFLLKRRKSANSYIAPVFSLELDCGALDVEGSSSDSVLATLAPRERALIKLRLSFGRASAVRDVVFRVETTRPFMSIVSHGVKKIEHDLIHETES